MAQQTPDFNNIAQAFGAISNAFQTISHEVSLVPNLPNFNVNLGQQLAQQLANIQTVLQNLDTRNLSRVLNSCVSDPHVNLEVVTDLNGNTPNNYSQSIDALRGMTVQELDQLLNFYGLHVNGSIEEKCRRFARYIGIESLL